MNERPGLSFLSPDQLTLVKMEDVQPLNSETPAWFLATMTAGLVSTAACHQRAGRSLSVVHLYSPSVVVNEYRNYCKLFVEQMEAIKCCVSVCVDSTVYTDSLIQYFKRGENLS